MSEKTAEEQHMVEQHHHTGGAYCGCYRAGQADGPEPIPEPRPEDMVVDLVGWYTVGPVGTVTAKLIRRAYHAEARVRELEGEVNALGGFLYLSRKRVESAERENKALREKLEALEELFLAAVASNTLADSSARAEWWRLWRGRQIDKEEP